MKLSSFCGTVLLIPTEECRCRRLCNWGNGERGFADTAWCSDDCLPYGLATSWSHPPWIWQYRRSDWNTGEKCVGL